MRAWTRKNDSTADEFEGDETPGGGGSEGASWPVLGRASRESADTDFDEQTASIRLQKEHLHEQRLLLLSHLRWRRFDDEMQGASHIMVIALAGIAVAVVAAAVWNASRADGFVVEAFSVPQPFAQADVTGEVPAEDFTGRTSAR